MLYVVTGILMTSIICSVYFYYLHKRGKKAEREFNDKLSGYYRPKRRPSVKKHVK